MVLSRVYTWHRHVDRRECLRGADVDAYVYTCLLSGFPVYKETNNQYPPVVASYIVDVFLHLSRVGLNLSFYFDYRRHGSVSSVG